MHSQSTPAVPAAGQWSQIMRGIEPPDHWSSCRPRVYQRPAPSPRPSSELRLTRRIWSSLCDQTSGSPAHQPLARLARAAHPLGPTTQEPVRSLRQGPHLQGLAATHLPVHRPCRRSPEPPPEPRVGPRLIFLPSWGHWSASASSGVRAPGGIRTAVSDHSA